MTPPPIETVVETAVYATDLVAAEAFYAGVLGLEVTTREAGRHVFFRVGPGSMFLVFDPTMTIHGDQLPAHGTTGPGHFAFGVRPDTLDDWRRHLVSQSVVIEQEVDWLRGGHSVYFPDPAGNAVELVTPGIWGTPAGW